MEVSSGCKSCIIREVKTVNGEITGCYTWTASELVYYSVDSFRDSIISGKIKVENIKMQRLGNLMELYGEDLLIKVIACEFVDDTVKYLELFGGSYE